MHPILQLGFRRVARSASQQAAQSSSNMQLNPPVTHHCPCVHHRRHTTHQRITSRSCVSRVKTKAWGNRSWFGGQDVHVPQVLGVNKANKKGDKTEEEISAMKTAAAEFIRDGLLKLGPTFVKLGQVCAASLILVVVCAE